MIATHLGYYVRHEGSRATHNYFGQMAHAPASGTVPAAVQRMAATAVRLALGA